MNRIDTISIDNMYEDDGRELAAATLASLEGDAGIRLIAAIPEYDGPRGRMNRLDILTAPADDNYEATPAEHQLLTAIEAVKAERKAAHEAALEKLERPITVVPVAGQ
jgi:hypothetical protein